MLDLPTHILFMVNTSKKLQCYILLGLADSVGSKTIPYESHLFIAPLTENALANTSFLR